MATRHHERSDFPFVKADDHGVLKFWAVSPSDDAQQDYKIGYNYGRQVIAYCEKVEDSTQFLVDIIRHMVAAGRFGPLEFGFVDAVATGASLHQHAVRTGHVYEAKPGEVKSDKR